MLTLWTWKVTNLGGSEHWSTFWSTVSILGLHNDFNRKHRSFVRSRRICRKIILFSSSFRADTWFWSIHSSHDPFEIYGWKCSGYLILLCSSSLHWQNISKVNCFRVYRKLITRSSHAKKGQKGSLLSVEAWVQFGKYQFSYMTYIVNFAPWCFRTWADDFPWKESGLLR